MQRLLLQRLRSGARVGQLSFSTASIPATADVKLWDTAGVVNFAKGAGLDDDDVVVLTANKIIGKSLLNLTEEKLRADGMPRGPATRLAAAIAGIRSSTRELLTGRV